MDVLAAELNAGRLPTHKYYVGCFLMLGGRAARNVFVLKVNSSPAAKAAAKSAASFVENSDLLPPKPMPRKRNISCCAKAASCGFPRCGVCGISSI